MASEVPIDAAGGKFFRNKLFFVTFIYFIPPPQSPRMLRPYMYVHIQVHTDSIAHTNSHTGRWEY